MITNKMVQKDCKSYPKTARGSVRRGLWGDGRRNNTMEEDEWEYEE